ncbi:MULTISPECIES: hypothetical protein [Halococcus]|uniref:hypothetical protein n=1 Tax=Halococcus TaxID=2249 RepID=UPI000A400C25|nr:MULTISPECIES: hypothetical protein [Halococcus]
MIPSADASDENTHKHDQQRYGRVVQEYDTVAAVRARRFGQVSSTPVQTGAERVRKSV